MRRVHRQNFAFHKSWTLTSNDHSASDADVGYSWYVNKLACNAGKISGLLVSTMIFAQLFSKLIIKKSLQMLRESRHENLKILIAPLSIKLSSLKSTGTLSAVVLGLTICIS